MTTNENQIVVYQPNETVRLDVRLENETVWLTQAQLCALFGMVKSNVSYHLKNIFGTNELDYRATVQKIRTVRLEAGRNVAHDIEYWTGASLKDTGRLTFAAAKMGAEIIPGLLDSIRKATSERREYGKPPKSQGMKKEIMK